MVDSSKPVLLITGASSGIGEAAVRRFAAAGYNVVAVARRKELLEQLAAELSGQAEVVPLAASVSEDGIAETATALCMDRFGRLDVLINNAGSFEGIPVHDTTDDQLEDLIGVSIKAPFRFSREAVKVMKPGSSVIHIGSTYGLIGGFNGGAFPGEKVPDVPQQADCGEAPMARVTDHFSLVEDRERREPGANCLVEVQ